jgi:ribosome-associated protein
LSEIATKKTIIVPIKKKTDSEESNVKKISAPKVSKVKAEAEPKEVKPKKVAAPKVSKVKAEAEPKEVKPKKVAAPKVSKVKAEAEPKEVKPKKVAKPDIEVAKPAKITKRSSESKELDRTELRCIADAILDKKGSHVCSLDLSAIGTAICDYFVVCNADSKPQVLAIADNIEEMMHKKCRRKVLRMQGKENAFWIILDYANIVVHIFQTEYRQFYRMEDLWADAEKTIYTD